MIGEGELSKALQERCWCLKGVILKCSSLPTKAFCAVLLAHCACSATVDVAFVFKSALLQRLLNWGPVLFCFVLTNLRNYEHNYPEFLKTEYPL